MIDACAAGREADHAILLFKIWSIGDKEYPTNSDQRFSQRRPWAFKVPDMDVGLVTEESFGFLRTPNENRRARARVDQPLSYP